MNERKLYVKSYGCQMNVYDSGRMADLLAPEGFVETGAAEDADLIILNTCHIREKAAEKVYSELGRVRQLKEAAAQSGRRVTVAVAGCVAQAEGQEIIHRAPVVDLVVGPQSYHRLPDLLARAEQNDRRQNPIVETEFPPEDKFDHLPAPTKAATRARGVTGFVTVQEGCDKFCTFCVVPYTRGAEVSRPAEKILAEVRNLVAGGVRGLSAHRRSPSRRAARPRADFGFHRRVPGRDRSGVPRHALDRRPSRLFGFVLVQVFAAPRHAGRHNGGSGRRKGENRAPA